MTEEESIIYLLTLLARRDFTNKEYIKEIVDGELAQFQELFSVLTTIDWDSNISVDNAYEKSAEAIYNINYLLLVYMVKFEELEDYENAKTFRDLAFQTYKIIRETTDPLYDQETIKEEIQNTITESVGFIKQALQHIYEQK